MLSLAEMKKIHSMLSSSVHTQFEISDIRLYQLEEKHVPSLAAN
jgi:hypothetical protein